MREPIADLVIRKTWKVNPASLKGLSVSVSFTGRPRPTAKPKIINLIMKLQFIIQLNLQTVTFKATSRSCLNVILALHSANKYIQNDEKPSQGQSFPKSLN